MLSYVVFATTCYMEAVSLSIHYVRSHFQCTGFCSVQCTDTFWHFALAWYLFFSRTIHNMPDTIDLTPYIQGSRQQPRPRKMIRLPQSVLIWSHDEPTTSRAKRKRNASRCLRGVARLTGSEDVLERAMTHADRYQTDSWSEYAGNAKFDGTFSRILSEFSFSECNWVSLSLKGINWFQVSLVDLNWI